MTTFLYVQALLCSAIAAFMAYRNHILRAVEAKLQTELTQAIAEAAEMRLLKGSYIAHQHKIGTELELFKRCYRANTEQLKSCNDKIRFQRGALNGKDRQIAALSQAGALEAKRFVTSATRHNDLLSKVTAAGVEVREDEDGYVVRVGIPEGYALVNLEALDELFPNGGIATAPAEELPSMAWMGNLEALAANRGELEAAE